MRAIFGPTNDNEEWRIKYNNELYILYRESDTVTYIKINRLKWAGHVIRMEEQSDTRRVLVVAVCRRKKTEGQAETEIGRWCDGRWRDGRWCDGRWEMA